MYQILPVPLRFTAKSIKKDPKFRWVRCTRTCFQPLTIPKRRNSSTLHILTLRDGFEKLNTPFCDLITLMLFLTTGLSFLRLELVFYSLPLSYVKAPARLRYFALCWNKHSLASTGFLEHLKKPSDGALSTQCLPSPSH